MQKKYIVRLSDEERKVLAEVIKKQKGSSQKVRRCRFCSRRMRMGRGGRMRRSRRRLVAVVRRWRTFVSDWSRGASTPLERKKTPPTPPKLDGEQEAKLIAMRLGTPPAGYANWTLQLLADELVALEVVDSISHETVRRTLKKTE